MNIIKGGVTAAKGFKAAGCEAQIKYKNGKKDMALVYSEKPCVTAGTFTTNKVFAAPVKWDRNIVYNEDFAQAVVVNSGVANACTGVEGDNACAEEAKAVAKVLDVPENAVLIGSTGVIGMQLPVDRICAGIEKLAPMLDASLEAGTQAAEAIMTTDTRSKQVAVEVEVAGTKVTIGGMCKGAGMIHPNMATMLCYITTDCDIDKALLQKMTSAIVDDSFNMISVDGDTSTNDTALVLANGMAGNKKITEEGAGTKVTIGGMCKGAGMIHPNMATMLCYITTDCDIDKALLQKMTSAIVDDSFNMISVDGDTSTNDTALVLANGMAGNKKITEEGADYNAFYEGLSYVFTELSKMIAGDGEGCTCLFEVQVKGATTKAEAKTLAKSIVTSSLTKAAIFGHDANWGRILCAMGYSGADFDPEKVDIFFKSSAGELQIVKDGTATDYSEEKATEILSQNPVIAIADVKQGDASATAWGCDLTFDYVKINADYRS